MNKNYQGQKVKSQGRIMLRQKMRSRLRVRLSSTLIQVDVRSNGVSFQIQCRKIKGESHPSLVNLRYEMYG